MFKFSEVEEVSVGGKTGLYIYPGIHEVKILGWDKGFTPNDDPFLILKLITLKADQEGDPTAAKEFKNDFRLYGGSLPYTMTKIKHIVSKVAPKDSVKDVANLDEMVAMLNSLTKNKTLRMKFNGEEYEYNNEIKAAARIGTPVFAEAIEEGAEYPVVSDADSKLTFDKTNQYDFKTLPKDNSTVTANTAAPAKTPW